MQTLLRSALAISAMGIAVGLLASCGGGGGGGGGGGSGTPAFSAAITGTSRIVANRRYDYSATAANGAATNFGWDWGDTTTSPTTNGSVNKVWYQPRNSTTTLTVTGSAGALATSTQAYTVITHPVMTKAEHACAIRADNTVACWGNNDFGQLGDATQITRTTPVAVKGLTNAIGLTGNDKESCALLGTFTVNAPGGTVVCWGAIDTQGAPTASNINFAPTPVSGLSNVVSLASGSFHHCALKADGTVWCWGYQASRSVFGNGPVLDPTLLTLAPVQVAGITDATVLASGNDHVCIIRANKTVKCWGWNDYGQTGSTALTQNGLQPVTDTTTPFAVPGVTNAVSLSLGAATSCAVLANGGMQCWGDNDRGQNASGTAIGVLGTQLVHFKPTPVTTPITNVAAGAQGFPACALKTNGSVTCWGDAQPVNSLSHPSALEAIITQLGTDNAYVSSGAFTCVLKIDGRLFCRGVNNAGQLGDGSGLDSPVAFVQVVMGEVLAGSAKPNTAIASSQGLSCVIKGDNTVACWNANFASQPPVTVAGLTDIKAITASSGNYSISFCATKTDGTTYCWGSALVVTLSTFTTSEAIAIGDTHLCSIKADQSLECRGTNNWGQLGNGTNFNSAVPVAVQGVGGVGTLGSIVSISGGEVSTCAANSTGAVFCWGYNASNQLGNGGYPAFSNTPVAVKGISGVGTLSSIAAVASGASHSCALGISGEVVCWGYDYNTLGRGVPATYSAAAPGNVVDVSGTGNLTNVKALATSFGTSCALKNSGNVVCWGEGGSGELGNGATADSSKPVEVKGLNGSGLLGGISAISLSARGAACGLKSNGEVWCWGYGYGSTPVLVTGLSGVILKPLLFWK